MENVEAEMRLREIAAEDVQGITAYKLREITEKSLSDQAAAVAAQAHGVIVEILTEAEKRARQGELYVSLQLPQIGIMSTGNLADHVMKELHKRGFQTQIIASKTLNVSWG